ncbi:MAG TPA: hypothetical protein VL651_13210 [Bacteroidia bacterium]|jgi:hypothetical protein|nr:hypothetical protein [Bacteroidia bacterium]
MTDPVRQEGLVFGKYLLGGKIPSERSLDLYVKFAGLRKSDATPREKKILSFAARNRWAIGMLDSALAFSKKESLLRKRLLAMTAILETQPEYAHLFLPEEKNWFYNIYIFWVGTRAVMKMVPGKFLLLFL